MSGFSVGHLPVRPGVAYRSVTAADPIADRKRAEPAGLYGSQPGGVEAWITTVMEYLLPTF